MLERVQFAMKAAAWLVSSITAEAKHKLQNGGNKEENTKRVIAIKSFELYDTKP